RIGQVNTVDLDEIYARQADLTAAMQEEATAEGYDLFLLIATDILNSNSVGFMVGSGKDQIEAAFGQTFDGNNRIDLPGVVSRKKQVVPQLTAAFEG
ncbi:DHHA2 domain-containing protein, partial [Lacticaseibacillus saniviri]|nr:manganese-dependent inorganic pyrophosphatase [Lacticaseibacillus saniviri]